LHSHSLFITSGGCFSRKENLDYDKIFIDKTRNEWQEIIAKIFYKGNSNIAVFHPDTGFKQFSCLTAKGRTFTGS
jgi:hypothetical protein